MLEMDKNSASQTITLTMTGSGNRWMKIRLLLSLWVWSQTFLDDLCSSKEYESSVPDRTAGHSGNLHSSPHKKIKSGGRKTNFSFSLRCLNASALRRLDSLSICLCIRPSYYIYMYICIYLYMYISIYISENQKHKRSLGHIYDLIRITWLQDKLHWHTTARRWFSVSI